MRLPLSSVIHSAVLWNLANGFSVPGQVFLNDESRRLSHSSAIDLSTARSILVQILGLSQFYTLNSSNRQAIEQVDKFDSPSLEIFGTSQYNGRRALVIVEGFSNPEGKYISEYSDMRTRSLLNHFIISSSPTTFSPTPVLYCGPTVIKGKFRSPNGFK